MKSKKALSILIGVLFGVVVIVSAFFVFTVKEIKGRFTFTDNIDAGKVQTTLDNYSGGNLLFFSPDQMVLDIEKNPYLKVTAVTKKYPNVVEVSVEERREVYLVNYSDKTYIADPEGFVLCELTDERKNSSDFNPRDFITLNFEGKIYVKDLAVGQKITTDYPETLSTAFALAEKARLTDCIKQATIDVGASFKDVYFATYTGVNIVIRDVNIKGAEKIHAVEIYMNEESDYVKTFGNLIADHDDSGRVFITHTDMDA